MRSLAELTVVITPPDITSFSAGDNKSDEARRSGEKKEEHIEETLSIILLHWNEEEKLPVSLKLKESFQEKNFLINEMTQQFKMELALFVPLLLY